MKPIFKVSDVVTIRRDLKYASSGDVPFGICDNMEKYAGKQAKIKEVHPNAKSINAYPECTDFDCARYRLDIDEGQWSWSNVMFETKPFISTTKEEDLLLCCTCSLN